MGLFAPGLGYEVSQVPFPCWKHADKHARMYDPCLSPHTALDLGYFIQRTFMRIAAGAYRILQVDERLRGDAGERQQ